MNHIHPEPRVSVRLLAAAAIFTLVAIPGPARADLLPLPNYSFELPTTTFVDTNIDVWQKNPQPGYFDPMAFGGINWTQTSGVFKNTPIGAGDHIDNIDQNQAVFLLNFPGNGLYQDSLSTGGLFNATFIPGFDYSFTLGVIGGGGGMSEGSQLAISLYYLDEGNNRVTLATTPITYTAAGFQGTNHFVDFSVSIPTVQDTDAWADQPLGIAIDVGPGNFDFSGYFDVDNARIVPEPASFGLLALGGLLLAAQRRRRAC